MKNLTKAYLQLHIAVFLFGFTAILGKLISLAEGPLVWYRLLITCASLLLFPKIIKKLKTLDYKTSLKLAGIGCLVCMHWLFFYGSIKYANVSVALSCLATTSFFTAFIEPVLFREKIKKTEVLLGLIVIAGIFIIFQFTSFFLTGIILGLLAALMAAFFSTLNKKMVAEQDSITITFVELASALVFLSLLSPLYLILFPGLVLIPDINDWIWLFILSIACTTVAYIISLNALKHITAFTSNLTINLEPVYGILLAILFFNEHKDLNYYFYGGTLLILSAVFIHPLLNKKFYKRKKMPPPAT